MAKTIKRLPKRVNEMAMSMSTGSTAARWFLPGILKRNGKKGLVKQVGDGRVWRRARNRIVAIDHVVDDEDDADRARDDDIGLVFFPSERSDGVFPHSPSEAGLLFLFFFLPFFSLAGFPSIGLTFYLVDLDDFKPLDRFAQFLLLMVFKVQLWKFVILNPSTIHFFLHLDQCEAVFF